MIQKINKPVSAHSSNDTLMDDKIVALDADTETQLRSRLSRLPAPVIAVKDEALRQFAKLFRQYFDKADDRLFELADKAATNEEQNVYFESMRELRLRRVQMEKRFHNTLIQAFAVLTDPNSARQESFSSIKADALSLVENEDLDTLVAVDTAVARANANAGEAMQLISLRLDSLLPVKVYQKNMPLGADVVCKAFMDQVRVLDVNLKVKLVLFNLFDRIVVQALSGLYEAVNQVLIEHNILPSLSNRAASNRIVREERRAPMLASRQSGPAGQRPKSEAAPALSLSREAQNSLAQLFGGDVLDESELFVDSEQLSNRQVVQLLNVAQKMPALQGDGVLTGQSLRTLIDRLKQKAGSRSVNSVDEQVMSLVSSLFDVILDDGNLPALMKTLISRMQIPIIKLAIADKTFFTKSGHVARRLLNEMATAAIGWSAKGSRERDPLYSKINSIVKRLVSEGDSSLETYSELLADFTAFLEKERKRVALFERRTVDAEGGKAKAELARTTVAIEIEIRCAEYQFPDAIDKLINEAWNNVLFVCALKHGYQSDEWDEALITLEQLVASLHTPSDSVQRTALIKSVPPLLKKIRKGLDTISYNPYEMSALFKGLEAVHLQCIRGQSPVKARFRSNDKGIGQELVTAKASSLDVKKVPSKLETAQVQQQIQQDKGSSTPSKAEQEALRLQKEQAIAEAQRMNVLCEQVKAFVQGAWFELQLAVEDSSLRARLAAFIKPTGKYIFVDRSGKKVAEFTEEDLVALLAEERLKALDTGLLFDRALETIVTGLRKQAH
ncbi:DUF1631 domain-containing protein [Agaribacterium sp. ZY112]|uniref:DUF1631 domain-containing protein n=1 Tax=Agaribacterium sp. ZY112 TaxID=3233574 RepID=UPI0035236766